MILLSKDISQTFRSNHRRCPVEKVFLKILQILQANTCVGVLVANFIKKRLRHKCFPVKFEKFLRTPILKNIRERMLLNFKDKPL